jgi:hypothetical protein
MHVVGFFILTAFFRANTHLAIGHVQAASDLASLTIIMQVRRGIE